MTTPNTVILMIIIHQGIDWMYILLVFRSRSRPICSESGKHNAYFMMFCLHPTSTGFPESSYVFLIQRPNFMRPYFASVIMITYPCVQFALNVSQLQYSRRKPGEKMSHSLKLAFSSDSMRHQLTCLAENFLQRISSSITEKTNHLP